MTVDIAIIDSGINPGHSHVNGVAGGISFKIDGDRRIEKHAGYHDDIGHGTAIAGIIRQGAPRSNLHAVKIFHENLKAPAALLIEGLKWAVEHRKKIIHLSLGTEAEAYRVELENLCKTAWAENLIVIAAGRCPEDAIFPAAFETVIGVCRQKSCEKDMIVYYPGSPIEFGACGWPRQLPGVPREMNFSGHSFAVAHVTARVAKLLTLRPDAGPAWVKKRLIEVAVA